MVAMNINDHNEGLLIIGLMSGTSLDGLDVAYCRFDSPRHFQLLAAHTFDYPEEWRQRLASLDRASALEYAQTDVDLGHYFGKRVNEFRTMYPGSVDLIASHGHTVFHQPQCLLTSQIGDGDAIAAETRIPVAFNFRSLDVALGGQGAPLVPIGDQLLFSDYESCLNLGGISNISFQNEGSRMAFDISPCNMALNYLAGKRGLSYDRDGLMASEGVVDVDLLERLNNLVYYALEAPKTLGKEWFLSDFLPQLEQNDGKVEDKLRTVVEHIAIQIGHVVERRNLGSMIVTGGGAINPLLMRQIRYYAQNCKVVIPDRSIVEYKEAIIFALLGYLRVTGQVNTLTSVTGAACDSIGGCLSGLVGETIN